MCPLPKEKGSETSNLNWKIDLLRPAHQPPRKRKKSNKL